MTDHLNIDSRTLGQRELAAEHIEDSFTAIFCEYAVGEGYIVTDAEGHSRHADTADEARRIARRMDNRELA